MIKEYKFQVLLKPHDHDNPKKPYFWCILGYTGDTWCNVTNGWAENPEKAFTEGMKAYSVITEN